MENIPLNANRHLRFQKCLPTESSQSASRVADRTGSVNMRLPFICGPDWSIRMDDLRAGRAVSRRYRNRRIGEFLRGQPGLRGYSPQNLWRMRQREILTLLAKGDPVTSASCMKRYAITRQAVNADFNKLLELELIQRVGAGRATRYELKTTR